MRKTILFLTLCLLALPVFGLMFSVATNIAYAGQTRPHVNPTVTTVAAASLTALDTENKEFLTCLSDKGAFVAALGTQPYVDMTNYYHDAKTSATQPEFNAALARYRTSKTKVAGTTGC